jgi:ubiquinone/menaquinone biosynthesis C-methylase UbiE
MLNIKSTDLVLEIGSGNRPRRRSNILCDKFVESNYERSHDENVVIDKRPFVVADGIALPFKDKCFDYVITSHILEHVDDPKRFVAELARVAKAGYIETPSELGEIIFGWPFHKWIVRFENSTIIMRPRIANSPFGDYFHQMYQHDPFFTEFIDSHLNDFYVQYEWKENIPLTIEMDSSTSIKFNESGKHINVKAEYKSLLISLIRVLLKLLLKVIKHFRKFE